MRTEYKVVKPFGCAKAGDIFKLAIDTFDGIEENAEYEMEDTKTTKKGTNSRYMSINMNYIDALVKGGNLKPWGADFIIEEDTDEDEVKEQIENLPSTAELKLMALEAFLDDCANNYQRNLNKIQEDYQEGKVQPCVKVESETVNYNLIKFIKAVKQILDVDKANDE